MGARYLRSAQALWRQRSPRPPPQGRRGHCHGDEWMAFPARATHGTNSDLLEPACLALTSPCTPPPRLLHPRPQPLCL